MNMTSVCVSGLVNRVNRVSRVAVWSAGGARPASVCGAVEPDGRTECKITQSVGLQGCLRNRSEKN